MLRMTITAIHAAGGNATNADNGCALAVSVLLDTPQQHTTSLEENAIMLKIGKLPHER